MADIVNLRVAKKRKARAERDVEAAANRAKFGRTKAEREKSAAETTRAATRLDGHKRED